MFKVFFFYLLIFFSKDSCNFLISFIVLVLIVIYIPYLSISLSLSYSLSYIPLSFLPSLFLLSPSFTIIIHIICLLPFLIIIFPRHSSSLLTSSSFRMVTLPAVAPWWTTQSLNRPSTSRGNSPGSRRPNDFPAVSDFWREQRYG